MIQYLPFLILAVPVALLIIAAIRYNMQQGVSGKAWEEWEKEAPEEFLADDEWVFVKYKEMLLPMTHFEKLNRWDHMSGREKREAYLLMVRQSEKGRIQKVKTEDGNTMFLKTKKGGTYLVDRYNKIAKGYERRFGQSLHKHKKDATRTRQPEVRRQFARKH